MFKTRLLSGIVLVIAALVLIITGGDVLLVSTLLISWIGMFELYRIFHIEKSAPGIVGYAAAAVYYANLRFGFLPDLMMLVLGLLIVLMFVYVFTYPKYQTEQLLAAFFGVFYVAVMLSYVYQTRMLSAGTYIVWLIFLCSWGCDTCAYCVGMLIGKHKMTPKLSPTQVVLAHLPHRCSPSSGDHLPLLFVTGYSRISFGIFQRACSASCSGRKRGLYPLTLLGDENHSCTKFFRFPISFLICEVC